MAVSHVATATNTNDNGTSVTTSRPAGSSAGDLMLAFFTSNAQNASTPAGWTEIVDETIESFRLQVFWKVVASGEAASYAFTVESAAPLVLTITALRGVNTSSPIDITPGVAAIAGSAEPYSTPTVSGGTAGRLVHMRAVRYSGTTPPTFTSAAGATELADSGVFSGGSVCYSHGLYLSNSDYLTSGSKPGLAITTSQTESHNIAISLGIKASTIPGTMSMDLILPTMTASAAVAIPGDVDVEMPLPDFDGEVWNGDYEASVDIAVPVLVDVDGYSDIAAALGTDIMPVMEFEGETRRFSDNVVRVVRDHRWVVVTQDGYYNGSRIGSREFRFTIRMPLLVVDMAINVSALGHTQYAAVEAFQATVVSTTTVDATTEVTATAYDATILTGEIPATEPATATAEALQPSIVTTFNAGMAEVMVEVLESKPFAVEAEVAAPVEVTAHDAMAVAGVTAYADLVRVRVVGVAYAIAQRTTATVSAKNATVVTTAGNAAPAEAAGSTTVEAFNASVGSSLSVNAGLAEATAEAYSLFTAPVEAEALDTSANVTAFNAVGLGVAIKFAYAEHVSVNARTFINAPSETVSTSIIANDATVDEADSAKLAYAGHASATCHN